MRLRDSLAFISVWLGCIMIRIESFDAPTTLWQCSKFNGFCFAKKLLHARSKYSSDDGDEYFDDDDADNVVNEKNIPLLPLRGYLPPSEERQQSSPQAPLASFVRPKLELQYTCNVCNTRNVNLISRIGMYTFSVTFALLLFLILFRSVLFSLALKYSLSAGRSHRNLQKLQFQAYYRRLFELYRGFT
jgi:hypothetical protein